MTIEQFDQLVNRIQLRYGSRPLSLRLRIAVLVGLGYAGFLAVLLTVLVLSGLLIAGALLAGKEPGIFLMALVALLLAFGLCQVLVFLWVPMESQPGRDVLRKEVPQLYGLLDRLQSEQRVRAFHHVRITADFNAGVQMIPRLGVFGFNRSYLYLGLPLMTALTANQFSAVLAHEFAHSSSRHDRFGMWIYRLRQTWSRVFAELHEVPSAGFARGLRRIVLWFVDWYWPRFNAHAFVLSRSNEYEADRMSAEWAGVDSAAEALFRIECVGIRLNDKFWFEMTQLAKTQPEVPDDILAQMSAFLANPPDPSDATRWLEQSAQTLTGNVDTHPSLSDRLKSLGQTVRNVAASGFPVLPVESAATVLLGPALDQIAADVNRQWQKENTLRWSNVYHQARRLEKQLEAVKPASPAADAEQVPGSTAYDAEQAWQQARTVCELHGTAAAEPMLRKLLDHRPAHLLANITLGRHLLERGLAEGEQYLQRVLDADDSDLIPAACHGLITYYQQLGQVERVREARLQLSRFETAQAAAVKERSLVTPRDCFVAHGLTEQELETVTQSLAQHPELGAAWLVRKELQHFKKQRLFVLVVQGKPSGLFGRTKPDDNRMLVSRLIAQVKVPGQVLIIAPDGSFRALARKIMAQPEARVPAARAVGVD